VNLLITCILTFHPNILGLVLAVQSCCGYLIGCGPYYSDIISADLNYRLIDAQLDWNRFLANSSLIVIAIVIVIVIRSDWKCGCFGVA